MYHSRLAFALAMAALAAILVPSSLTAQITFQRTYGGVGIDEGWSVEQTADGGYIIAGSTESFGAGHSDVYLIKADAHGDTLWTRALGGAFDDGGNSVQQTADSGYIIAGLTCSFGVEGVAVYLIKTDTRGDTLWTRTFVGELDAYGCSVQQTADGGYIIAGVTRSSHLGTSDVYLVKTDANGDTLWTRTYGGEYDDQGSSVQQTADGGYVIAGSTAAFGGFADVYLIKTDSGGDTLWTRTFGGAAYDCGASVQQTTDSGYIVVGTTGSFGAGNLDVYHIRTDANGDTIWTRNFGGPGDDWGNSVRQTVGGGFIVCGQTWSSADSWDVVLVRTDASGNALWTKMIGGPGNDLGRSVRQTSDGGLVITGSTSSSGAGGPDIYLIKTDSLGNVAVAEPKASPTRAPALSLSCEPNPFRTRTAISLQLTADSPAELTIFDAAGRRVRTLTVNRTPYTVWDGSDELGYALPSGTYFVILTAGGQHVTARLVLQR